MLTCITALRTLGQLPHPSENLPAGRPEYPYFTGRTARHSILTQRPFAYSRLAHTSNGNSGGDIRLRDGYHRRIVRGVSKYAPCHDRKCNSMPQACGTHGDFRCFSANSRNRSQSNISTECPPARRRYPTWPVATTNAHPALIAISSAKPYHNETPSAVMIAVSKLGLIG